MALRTQQRVPGRQADGVPADVSIVEDGER
jgi:hypothetical protein